MSKGYVYVLSNPSMPGLVKIGKTTRPVEQRCAELWQTGVPTPFEVVCEVLSPDCHELERAMHLALGGKRVSPSREFFAADRRDVAIELKRRLHAQVCELVDEFLPNFSLVGNDIVVDGAALSLLSQGAGVEQAELIDSIGFIEPAEILPAIRRWRDFRDCKGISMDYDEVML